MQLSENDRLLIGHARPRIHGNAQPPDLGTRTDANERCLDQETCDGNTGGSRGRAMSAGLDDLGKVRYGVRIISRSGVWGSPTRGTASALCR
jgi:hypothetical protein